MKQSAAKTLGVAALGAAVAAVGAGVANAAPAAPDVARTLDTATKLLPPEQVAETLPDSGAVKTLKPLAKSGVRAAVPAARKAAVVAQPVAERAVTEGPAKPVGGLLGGLPVNGLHGTPVNGIPLG
ncbi:ATP-binding protein [Streptomyces sp. NPDC038707]|uniref:ATP-binding protein n=1 Tax=unclassified Streptomyces TaxID=2593676 RepID=UPI00340B61E5